MGLSIVDLMTGLNAAFALVSGVLSARATGKGRDIDVNLFDTALQNLSISAVWYLNAGVNQGREPRSQPPLADAEPALPHARRLHLHHVQQGEVLARAVPLRSAGRSGARAPDYKDFKARLANRAQLTARAGRRPVGEHDGRMDRDLRRPRAGGARQRRARRAGKPVRDGGGRVRTVDHPSGPIRLLAASVTCPGEELPCDAGARHGRGYGCGPGRGWAYGRRDRRAAQSRRGVSVHEQQRARHRGRDDARPRRTSLPRRREPRIRCRKLPLSSACRPNGQARFALLAKAASTDAERRRDLGPRLFGVTQVEGCFTRLLSDDNFAETPTVIPATSLGMTP